VESKSFRAAGFGWFAYLVTSSLGLGFAMGITAYWPPLLISLGFPRFRRYSDAVLQTVIAALLDLQPWLSFDYQAFDRALSELNRDRKTGVLLVSNHRSHLDTFLLLSRVRGIRVLAKRGLFFVPFLGFIMWTSRQIPVRRKNLKAFVSAMDTIADRLRAGEIVHVFPEMTRSPPEFRGVAPFNAAPFLVAMKVGVPIFPIAVRGTGETWPKGSFSLKPGTTVRLLPLASIPATRFSDFAGAKELAEFCRLEIESA
jgi:1-acyl-sn-glycerol-3-phosphate acyltransferase